MVDSQNQMWVLGFWDAQVVSPLSAEFLSSKDGGQAPHVEGSMTI